MDEGMTGNWADAERLGRSSDSFTEPDDPAAIRAEIQRTRERMGRTVEELGDRLNPHRLKAELKQNIHDATIGKAENMARNAIGRVDDTRHNLMDNVRENPIPAAMIGIGLGWLFLNNRRSDGITYRERDLEVRSSPYGLGYSGTTINRSFEDGEYDQVGFDTGFVPVTGMGTGSDQTGGRTEELRHRVGELRQRTEEATHRAQDRVTEIAHDARDRARSFVDRAQDALDTGSSRARVMASDVMNQTRQGTHRVEDRFDEVLHDTPLAIGAAAVAIGMAIGLSAPSTRREAELMGGRRDELLDRARQGAGEMTNRVRDVADQVVNNVEHTVRDTINQSEMS